MFIWAPHSVRNPWPLKGVALAVLILGCTASSAQIPPPSELFSHTVQKGERLSTLLSTLLQLPEGANQALNDLKRINAGVDLHNLQAGQMLQVPKAWLQARANHARVTQVQCSGPHRPELAKPVSKSLSVGDTVGEGDLLRMPPGCQLMLTLQDGSRIHMPSGAVVEITRLQTPKALGAPQVRLKLLEGRMGLDVFNKRPVDSVFEVQTPKTLAGVRGTQFRVGFESETQNSRVEVLSGEVINQGGNDAQITPLRQGTGQLVRSTGSGEPPQTLPDAPVLQLDPLGKTGQLHFSAVPQAVAYAWRDSVAVNQFAAGGQRSPTTLKIETGTLGTRAQAWYVSSIDRFGLQGLDRTYALCAQATLPPDTFCSVAFDTSSFNGRPMQLTLSPVPSSEKSQAPMRLNSYGPDNGRLWIGALRPGQYRYDLSHLPIGGNAINPDHWVLHTGLFQLVNVHTGQP